MVKTKKTTVIELGPEDAALVVKEDCSLELFMPSISDDEIVNEATVYASLASLALSDDEIFKKCMERWAKIAEEAEENKG